MNGFLEGWTMKRLDKYHNEILNYINEQPGQTENKVVTEMKKRKKGSKVTILRKIKELKEMGEITDLLKDGESGFHKLYVKKEIEFKLIDVIIDNLGKTINETKASLEKKSKEYKKIERREISRDRDFFIRFVILINSIFELLLYYIPRYVSFERDRQVLNDRILELKIRMNSAFEPQFDKIISDVERDYKSSRFEPFDGKYGINMVSLNRLISVMRERYFLTAGG
jgi:hypothetical protein